MIYLVGLIVRFKRTFLHPGYDSILVVVAYLAGLAMMIAVLEA